MADPKQNSTPSGQPTLETRLRGAATQAEADLKRWIAYLNDEVVPDVRRNGSAALKSAAAELEKLAKQIDAANPPPPPPSGKSGSRSES